MWAFTKRTILLAAAAGAAAWAVAAGHGGAVLVLVLLAGVVARLTLPKRATVEPVTPLTRRRRRVAVAAVAVIGVAWFMSAGAGAAETTDGDTGWWAGTFRNGIIGAWDLLLDALFTVGDTVLGWVLNVLPANAMPDVSELVYYVMLLNAWAPIDLGLTLLGAFYAFLLAFVVVKFILKLLPGIG